MSRGVTVTPDDELADGVEPLTPGELRWLRRLQAVLADCPERLEIVTSGDSGLGVVDGPFVRAHGVGLHGVSG